MLMLVPVRRVPFITSLLVLSLCAAPAFAAGQRRQAARKPSPKANASVPAKPAFDMSAVQTQVMLDRAGYSPGEIDGAMGTSTKRALDAFTKGGGKADALPANAITSYSITEQDAAGPFTPDIPEDMVEKSKLPALGYSSLLEALGERFHCSPTLLKRLNASARFVPGETIQVPAVEATPPPDVTPRGRQSDAAPAPANPAATTVTVRRSTSDLTVTDASGRAVMYAPVTTGSQHDPLPIGEWKVTGVQRDPKFHYNPDLFWDAEPGDSKATIPPGPNNPVGVVWIDISRPHYGLHGTPEPSTVGKTASHGCVRLTNWDAQKLALLVRPGTKVVFAE
jgi:lipoprotein-anchoring transpeptidase ErfK/SrfK